MVVEVAATATLVVDFDLVVAAAPVINFVEEEEES